MVSKEPGSVNHQGVQPSTQRDLVQKLGGGRLLPELKRMDFTSKIWEEFPVIPGLIWGELSEKGTTSWRTALWARRSSPKQAGNPDVDSYKLHSSAERKPFRTFFQPAIFWGNIVREKVHSQEQTMIRTGGRVPYLTNSFWKHSGGRATKSHAVTLTVGLLCCFQFSKWDILEPFAWVFNMAIHVTRAEPSRTILEMKKNLLKTCHGQHGENDGWPIS